MSESTVRETLQRILDEDVGPHEGSAQEILIASKMLVGEALESLAELERDRKAMEKLRARTVDTNRSWHYDSNGLQLLGDGFNSPFVDNRPDPADAILGTQEQTSEEK